MKDNNYYVIQGWMVNQLNLKGNDLLLFAIIYGFSQDGESEFTGSLDYLCKSMNCSRNTAKKALLSLADKGLIKKIVEVKNNVIFNKYSVFDGVGQKLTEGGSVSDQGGGQFLTEGGSVSDPNNTINNNNIKYSNSIKKNKLDLDIIDLDEKCKELLLYWVGYKRDINKPIKSQSTILLLSKKIKSRGYDVSYKVINYSIENNYKGLFWDNVKEKKETENNPSHMPDKPSII